MWSTIFYLILLSILTILLTKYYKRRILLQKTIDQIPGPCGNYIFGVASNLTDTPENIWKYMRQLAAEYYPIYKYYHTHIPVVSLICPEDIEIVLSSVKYSAKSIVYRMLEPWLGTGLLTSSGSKWQSRRKILTPAFHFNILQQFIGIFTEESQLLIDQLRNECEKPFTDILPIVTQFTLHSICETAMGTKLRREDKKSQEYAKAVFRLGRILLYRITRLWYFYDVLFNMTPIYREQTRLLNTLHTFTKSVIENRKINFVEPTSLGDDKTEICGSAKRRLAMLDLLISANRKGQPIDDEGIREEVDTFMFEGHDTTTACISFTLLLLACHKNIQEKAVEELQELFSDSDRAPTFEDLQNMPYLERVLKESLRLYPSVPYISRVSDEDIRTFTGYTIPSNTIIQIHIYDVHHNPEIYPDPERFDPDRFLPENVKTRHPFAYIPFSAGPRNCIGQRFAFLEIKTIISYILRNFVLEPIDTPNDLTYIAHLIMKTKQGIRIKFTKKSMSKNILVN